MQVFRDYEGREIRLTNERMAHVAQRHRELLRIENAIGDTLAKPDTFLYDELDDEDYYLLPPICWSPH